VSNASSRLKKSTGILHLSLKAGCFAAIGVGALLGIPPMIKATHVILGNAPIEFGNWIVSSAILCNGVKYGILTGIAIGSYGLYKSYLPAIKKSAALGFCGLVGFDIFATSSSAIVAGLTGSSIPSIGVTIWALINAAQIYVTTLRQDELALKRILSSMGMSSTTPEVAKPSKVQQSVIDLFGGNKFEVAWAFFNALGVISYIAEFAVNIAFGAISTVAWSRLLVPGGAIHALIDAAWAIVILFFTIGSIEVSVHALAHLESMTNATDR